jgi:uncharacterized metal-binding protein
MGVGKIVANVTRRAAYLLKGQCPEDVELLSIPAFLAGDPEERALAANHPAVIIDGCALRCAAHIFRQHGLEAVAKIEVNQIMKEARIGPGKTRKELEASGRKLGDLTAERVLTALRDEGLQAEFAPALPVEGDAPHGAGYGCPKEGRDSAADHKSTDALPAPRAPHVPTGVSIMPCQGIKRTGGRITQRSAYIVAEDRMLGHAQVVCISALAAGVPEDIEMVERHPLLAVNGCGKRCASIAAANYGVPPVAEVDLQDVDPQYDGAAFCLEAELTDREKAESQILADAVERAAQGLLSSGKEWTPPRVDLHGLVVEPARINAATGYADDGRGILVRLAKRQNGAPAEPRAVPAANEAPPPAPGAVELADVAAAQAACQNDFPGLRNVAAGLFARKPKP